MLHVLVTIDGKPISLPTVNEGQAASLTDYTNPDTEILIFAEQKDFGYVIRSKAGIHIDLADGKRIVESFDKEIERKMLKGQGYLRDVKIKIGGKIMSGMLTVERT